MGCSAAVVDAPASKLGLMMMTMVRWRGQELESCANQGMDEAVGQRRDLSARCSDGGG